MAVMENVVRVGKSYRVRKRIPADCRAAFGISGEFKTVSLHTTNKREAQERAVPILADIDAKIAEARGLIASPTADQRLNPARVEALIQEWRFREIDRAYHDTYNGHRDTRDPIAVSQLRYGLQHHSTIDRIADFDARMAAVLGVTPLHPVIQRADERERLRMAWHDVEISGASCSSGQPVRSVGNRAVKVSTSCHAIRNRSLMPPDLGAHDHLTDDEIKALIADATDCLFKVTGHAGSPHLDVEVLLNGTLLGTLKLKVNNRAGAEAVTIGVRRPRVAEGATLDPQLERIIKTLRRGEGVNIHYDSGHTISDRRVFPTEYRRIAFTRFQPKDFPATDIDVEKPDDLSMIGTQRSLFCWLKRTTTTGHLMCDDGSMEKADFIHIADGVDPTITFYHIKGSHSRSPDRKISVSAYEVVTAQAKKNLIWLDKADLISGLKARVRPTNQHWHNNRLSSPAIFKSAVDRLSATSIRRVVVVQPSLSLTERKQHLGKKTANALRLDQLDFLLSSAENDCRSLRASFEVICAK